MREIKFRAWLPNRPQMIHNIQDCTREKDGEDFNWFLNNELSIVEQFTGLQDKNGVDIYEGDDLRSYHQSGEIIYHFGSFGFWTDGMDYFKTLESIMDQGDGHRMEVIGNIHEGNKGIKK